MQTRIEINDVDLIVIGTQGKELTVVTIADKGNTHGRLQIVMPNASFERFSKRIAEHYTRPQGGGAH